MEGAGGLAGEEEREEDAGGDGEGGEEEDWVWEEDDGKAVAGLEEEGLVSGGSEEAEGDADVGPGVAGLPEAEEGLVATDAAVGMAGALDRTEEGWLGLEVLLTEGI